MAGKKVKLLNRLANEKELVSNFFSLSSLTIMNYLFPLLTFPYLVRILGVEKFGLLNFSTAFIGYFILLTDYGFNISAVRLIAVNREKNEVLNELISAVYLIKLFLMFISTFIFLIVVYNLGFFKNEIILYKITFLIVIGNFLYPFWFFQGLEKTKFVAVITFLIRLIWAISVFVFINNANDYILAALLNSLQSIFIGIILFIVMIYKYHVKFIIPSFLFLKKQIIEGGIIFISSCAISLYTISNTFILGLLTSNIFVGYFSAADKIRQAIQSIMTPFTQSMYPHVSKLFGQSKTKAKRFIINSLKYVGTFSFLISTATFIFAEDLVFLFLGQQYSNSILVLRIISFLPFIIYLSNLFGIQTMLNLGMNKQFAIIISIAAVISIISSIILVPAYKEIGSGISMLITEIFVTAMIILYLTRKLLTNYEI